MWDVVLQMGHQTQVARAVQYHSLRKELRLFPDQKFGENVSFLPLASMAEAILYNLHPIQRESVRQH